MNIEVEGFTREQILNALFSSARRVRYEFTVQNSHGEHQGYAEIQNAVVSFDSSAKVMRTFKGRIKKSDLINVDKLDYRIIPWMCLEISKGKEAKWPLGLFVCSFSDRMSNEINYVEIYGYDLSKIALDDKILSRYCASTSNTYYSDIRDLVSSLYSRYEIALTTVKPAGPQEWEIGTSKLEIINELLTAINYEPLYFNEQGVATAQRYNFGIDKEVDFNYIANQTSVIIDEMSVETNKFSIPNKWIRYVENPNMPYLISVYTNDDPESPYSTVSRGRTIVDSANIDNVYNQATLDNLVKRAATEAMRSTEVLEFSTLNMPGHGYREYLFIDVGNYGIQGKFIERAWEMELRPGGTMKHVCERLVILE